MNNSTDLTPRILSPDELKLLKRLKLALWCVTLLFILHALPARFPELYPITRWAMFSEADRIPRELTEGYLARYELRAEAANGIVYDLPQEALYAGIPIGSSNSNVSFTTMVDSILSLNPDHQQQAQRALLTRLERIYDTAFVRVEVWRHYHEIDFDRYPHVDFVTPSYSEHLGTFTPDGQTEVIAQR